jgi:hypothetical protein
MKQQITDSLFEGLNTIRRKHGLNWSQRKVLEVFACQLLDFESTYKTVQEKTYAAEHAWSNCNGIEAALREANPRRPLSRMSLLLIHDEVKLLVNIELGAKAARRTPKVSIKFDHDRKVAVVTSTKSNGESTTGHCFLQAR